MTQDESEMSGADRLKYANIRVFTVKPEEVSKDWLPEALPNRKWGVEGVIVHYHNSHGKIYVVRHSDGSTGSYEPRELKLI